MHNISALSDKVVENIRKAQKLVKSASEAKLWINYINKTIRLINKVLKQNKSAQIIEVGYFSKLEANLCLLKFYKEKLREKKRLSSSQSQKKLVWCDAESCFKSRIRTGAIINLKYKDLKLFFEKTYKIFADKVKNALKNCLIKINVVFSANFILPLSKQVELKTFTTSNSVIDKSVNLKHWYKLNIIDKLMTDVTQFEEKDSGWALFEILNLKLNINNYCPIAACGYVDLPLKIKNKKAIVNVKNNDVYCFLWAVVSALYPVVINSNRISSYPHFSKVLKYESISFPMQLKSIPKFEKQNNISINVYTFIKDYEIVPIFLSNNHVEKQISLLIIANSQFDKYECDDISQDKVDFVLNNSNNHFMWIKNLSRLISKQTSTNNHKIYVCHRCINWFFSESKLNSHKIDCLNINTCRVNLPPKHENILKFKNFHHKEKVPFVVYADFECILEKEYSSLESNTKIIHKHIAFSVGYYFKCSYDDSLSYFKTYRGKDCEQWFVTELKQIAYNLETTFNSIVPMKELTNEQINNFNNATVCHICENLFIDGDIRVRDHCHLSGEFRGPAHSNCNLNYKIKKFIPIVFHNLSNYDANFLIKSIALGFEGSISLLPINKNKFISFSKQVGNTGITLRFIDSFRFMSTSISKLSSYLKDSEKNITRAHCDSLEKFELLTRKGIFPYQHVDSFEKLNETKLPAKEKFYSSLTGESVSQSDYEFAQKVWNIFNIKTLGEYSDLYLKTDILLLGDIMENFRDNCIATYQLDCLHYYTTPGFAYDAMLKTTRIELELLTDIDKILFIEKGIRGGLSQVSCRYAQANNKYMEAAYDSNKPDSYLMYFDFNNLYGTEMIKKLPYGDVEWVENIEEINICNLNENSDIGYILEVDLEYPSNLFESHNDLPLCPENITPPNSKYSKLCTTFYGKKNYVIHYMNLKQCLSLGMKLKCIHKALQFKQSNWLAPYIQKNNELRIKSTNEFSKNYFKLLNNAAFGKLLENCRKHRDVKLVTKWGTSTGAGALISKPHFDGLSIIADDIALIEMNKTSILFNKPIYVGFTILELAKEELYNFHYKFIKKNFGCNANLLYTDTDSLLYNFIDVDAYEIIKNNLNMFDTSEYPQNNKFGIPQVNAKVLGMMKDELKGEIMQEFVGLRAKMYAIKIYNEFENKINYVKKLKGVTNSTLKTITFDDYKKSLFYKTDVYRNQFLIQAKNFNVYTVDQKKLVLNASDDKRKIFDNDCVNTFAWGFHDNTR